MIMMKKCTAAVMHYTVLSERPGLCTCLARIIAVRTSLDLCAALQKTQQSHYLIACCSKLATRSPSPAAGTCQGRCRVSSLLFAVAPSGCFPSVYLCQFCPSSFSNSLWISLLCCPRFCCIGRFLLRCSCLCIVHTSLLVLFHGKIERATAKATLSTSSTTPRLK